MWGSELRPNPSLGTRPELRLEEARLELAELRSVRAELLTSLPLPSHGLGFRAPGALPFGSRKKTKVLIERACGGNGSWWAANKDFIMRRQAGGKGTDSVHDTED